VTDYVLSIEDGRTVLAAETPGAPSLLLAGVGWRAIGRDYLKHEPPTALELENAIAAIEDEIARLRVRPPKGSRVRTKDALVRDIALAAASMITGGIAARHPELRMAFSHGGGGLALLLPRLDHAWKMVPKAKESLAEAPTTYARRFFYDALVFSPQAVRFLADTYGVSQLIVGSDYPFAMGDPNPIATLQKTGLGPDVVAAITCGNAQRFLKLAT